ncbi:MAG: bifunctional diaminohydroxyphosphoribosylaminopyrimidine deaminase/5-amino-6-(5-phosphoribosylamino)uracil reductase RibD [Planctomycetota bacterium]|nr:bifunctional diaminohydroxyphosphoribosylaminopyrimidine deaminase/5-amino-6-(5-phosphoribosylamino)uracil reductase RibD [Planctomycetota bacterium]
MTLHRPFLEEALALAEQGRGWTSPNPVVGALVVKDGEVVGRGCHRRFGAPHAELEALHDAGAKARGAALYVTLEPCNHYGKTPPCTEAIVKAGVKTVVLGCLDPNPKSRRGLEALREKGVEVVEGVLERACREANAPFFKRMRAGLPLVSAKWAMTADGKIATARGDSKWITSPAARAHAHRLRGEHDAVLVGIGTVLTDAPLLTVRMGLADAGSPGWQPRRVLLDSKARTPLDAPLWTAENGGPITVFVSMEAPEERIRALEEKGAEVVALPAVSGALPVRGVLEKLAEQGVLSVFVEGGAEVLGSFLDARLVDRVYVFVAPKIVGGRDGVTAVRGLGVERVAECQQMAVAGVQQLGEDVLLEGRLGAWEWLEASH